MSETFFKFLLVVLSGLTVLPNGLGNEQATAIFYENEDKSGKTLNYFEETKDFQHIQTIVDEEGFSGLRLLCAKGIFILYNQEEFDSDSDDDVAILAGTDTCLPPGSVRSISYVQSYSSPTLDTITVFSGERFGGNTIPLKINENTQHKDASLMMMGQINSFLLMGSSSWTITTRYRTFCIKPQQTGAYPVCPVPYANFVFLQEELNWLSVRHGCSSNETDSVKVVSLAYCFSHGSGKLEPISVGNETVIDEVKGRADIERQWGSDILEDCGNPNLPEFSMLLKLRLTHDFNSVIQVQFPLNKAHSWRTELLDYTMEIVDTCIVDDLVDKSVLLYVRELYIYLAEKLVWNKGNGWPTKPRQRILFASHELGRCLTRMTEKQWVATAIKLSDGILKNMKTPGIQDSVMAPEFLPKKGYDIVMEFIWLSINYVGAACHAALEYETDFWMEYMNVAHDMYLQPMTSHWRNPEVVLKYYPILLGGSGVEMQRRGLAAATTALYKAVSVSKLERPSAVSQ